MVIALANRAEQVSSPALATALAPPGQTGRWLALSRAVFNAGTGGGAVLGSLAIAGGHRGAVALSLANAVSFLGTAVLHRSLPRVAGQARPERNRRVRPWSQPRFGATVAIATALWIVALAVESATPVFALRDLDVPPWTVGGLFAVNTSVLATFALPVGRWLEGRVSAGTLAVGTALHAALPLAFLALHAWPTSAGPILLLAAMVVYTLGEMVATQATSVLLAGLPPPAQRGSFLAFHQTVIGLATAVVPIFVTALLAHRPTLLWWALVLLAGSTVIAAPLSAGTDGSDNVQVPAPRRSAPEGERCPRQAHEGFTPIPPTSG
jgi:hypothetical protein